MVALCINPKRNEHKPDTEGGVFSADDDDDDEEVVLLSFDIIMLGVVKEKQVYPQPERSFLPQ